MSLISNTAPAVPKKSPLRAHFNTLPARSPPSGLQVPQYPASISRLGIPRSHSTSSLHDLVTDLRQQQYQQQLDDEEEKKRIEESSKNTISRHASFVVRYYNKAKSRSPTLSRALTSASPKKNIKHVPQQQSPLKKTKKPEPSLPIALGTSSTSSVTEPRLQRADSRVKVERAPTPLVEPSAAIIEEVDIPIPEPQQAVFIDEIIVEGEKMEQKNENGIENINQMYQDASIKKETYDEPHSPIEEKVQVDVDDIDKNLENKVDHDELVTTTLDIEPPRRQQMPSRSLSSPPTNSTSSWHAMRFDETDTWIQQGIEYHEKGELEQATLEFQRAANANSPIGLMLYGLCLMHAWGCKRSERRAFRYLQKSAEHAIFDIQQFVSGRGSKLIANRELVMAIYELGNAYCYGWGCHKDKKTAAYYFKIAADLGDADAQNEIGRCYQEGKGVKKNMKLAAKYYRKADQQGHGMVGNSWIYKEKYNDTPS